MIINRGHIESITNEDTVSFELNNDEGHLYGVLSELYSKPVESTIREIATNCSDAHILSRNEDRPFIIKLPNHEKNILNLCFRDFGPGLNHDEVMNVYRIYGVSTKSNTNKATGCLGLGSKSPFSITSTFFVKSYYNGTCSQYTCSMNNMGKPSISEVPQTFKTEEENGLEVIIPFYKEVDFMDMLPKILKYFRVKPIVIIPQGELVEDEKVYPKWNEELKIPVKKLTDTIEIREEFLDANKAIYCLDNLYSVHSKKIENEVIQLQIYYPLDNKLILDTIKRYNKLFTDGNNNTIHKFKISDEIISYIELLLKLGIRFNSEPGMIAFSPSRETIKYTDMTLYYIIQQLIKAATNYRKIIYSKYKHINTYDQAFDIIFSNNDQFNKAITYFKIDKSKQLMKLFEQVKSQEIDPVKFLGFGNWNSGQSFQSYSDGLFAVNQLEKGKLIHEKNKLSGSSYWYANIFNIKEGKLNNTNSGCFTFCQIDPFFEAVIESVVRKNIGMLLTNIYTELDNMYKFLQESDFVTRTEIYQNHTNRILNEIYASDRTIKDLLNHTNLKDEYKEYDILKLEKIMDTFNSLINDIEISSIYNKTLNKLGEELDERDVAGKTIYGYAYNLVSALKIYQIYMSRITTNTKYLRYDFVKMLPTDFTEIKLANAAQSLELIKLDPRVYSYIKKSISVTFNKIAVAKQKLSKRVFDSKLESEFKFEDFIERYKWFLSNPRINRFLPLKEFNLVKVKDQIDVGVFISNVIMHTYCKFFPNEFENTLNYVSDIEARRLEAIEELATFGIPRTKLINLRPVAIYKEQRTQEKRIVQEKKNKLGLYYYDFEITQPLINDLKYLLFKSVTYLKDYIGTTIDLLHNNEQYINHKNIIFKNEKAKSSTKGFNFGDYPLLIDGLNNRIKQAIKYIKGLKIDFSELTFENYNKIIASIYLCKDHINTIKKINIMQVRIDAKVTEPEMEYLIEHNNIYKRNMSELHISVVVDGKRYINKPKDCLVDQFGKEFIWNREGFYDASNDEAKELYEKLFKNKIVFLDANLKIKDFNNAFPEEFDMDLIRSTMGDSKIRGAKKKFFENNIFGQYNMDKFNVVREAVANYFPEYLFLDFNETISSKLYGPNVYNFYPFMFKWWKESGVKSLISYGHNWDNHSVLRYSREDFLIPTMWSSVYSKLYCNTLMNPRQCDKPKEYQKIQLATLNGIKQNSVQVFIWNFAENSDKIKMVKIIQKYLSTFGNKKLGRLYYGVSKSIINDEKPLIDLATSLMPEPFRSNKALVMNDWSQSYQSYQHKFSDLMTKLSGISTFMGEVRSYFPDIDKDAKKLDCSPAMAKLIKNNPKLFKLLKEFSTEFHNILGGRIIDTDNIKEIFDDYFVIKNKASLMVRYKGPEDFIKRYINKTTDETIHTKINARSKIHKHKRIDKGK